MGNTDFSHLWIDNENKKQRELLHKLEKAFNSLKDKETEYAKGIERMINLRTQIIELICEFREEE